MAFNINEFKSQLTGGGARANLFQVQILNPVDPVADFKIPFMVKGANIPSSDIASYKVNYFGRQVAYAGDRTFPVIAFCSPSCISKGSKRFRPIALPIGCGSRGAMIWRKCFRCAFPKCSVLIFTQGPKWDKGS